MQYLGIIFSAHAHAIMLHLVFILLKILFMLLDICNFFLIVFPNGLGIVHSLLLHLDLRWLVVRCWLLCRQPWINAIHIVGDFASN